jgi:hypothetical protein
MPNSSKQHSADDRQQPNAPLIGTDATYSTNAGPIAPPASEPQGAAGETSSLQPDSLRSMELLLDGLRALAWKGSPPAAAGVYARMKRIDPTFSYTDDGFSSFRQLLEEAELRRLVVVDRTPGSSDVTVRGVNLSVTSEAGPAKPRSTSIQINVDLWQALLDWHPGAHYVFNRVSGKTTKGTTADTADYVVVPSITKDEQLGWMRAFAEAQDSHDTRQALLSALDEDVPVKGFSHAVRDLEAAGRRWKRYLKKRVLDRATTWADTQGIPLSAIESVKVPTKAEAPSSLEPSTAPQAADDGVLKARVLDILASMPLSELLRLPIPVEYALKQ